MSRIPYGEERKRRYSLGVLLTGTLEKKGRLTGSWRPRFYVLTRKALHYYSTQSNSALFGPEKGSYNLLDLCDVKAVPWDPRCFEFTIKSQKRTKVFRAEDEEACDSWRTALEEAILEAHKAASMPTTPSPSYPSSYSYASHSLPASPLPSSARSVNSAISGGIISPSGAAREGPHGAGMLSPIAFRTNVYDYREMQRYWPKILSIAAGERADDVAVIKQNIAWGETVRLGQGQYHKSPSAAAILKLKQDREVVLRQRDFQQAVIADYEDLFPVRSSQPEDATRKHVVRLRFQSLVKPMPGLSFQTLLLPVSLLIFTFWFLLDYSKSAGRWIVFLLAVLVGSSILYNTYWREVRIWYLTPIAWERDPRDLQRSLGGGGVAGERRGRARRTVGSTSSIGKCTPSFAFLEWQDEMVIPTGPFLQGCEQVVNLLESFGLGFRPFQQFLHQCIRRVSEQYKLRPSHSLDLVIQLDVEHKVLWKENSASWSLLWITRLLSFVVLFLEEFSRAGKPDVAAWTAFKRHIEPFQAFTQKTAYVTALLIVPASRDRFLEQVARHVPERDRESIVQVDISEFTAALQPLLRSMTDFFVSNGLEAGATGADGGSSSSSSSGSGSKKLTDTDDPSSSSSSSSASSSSGHAETSETGEGREGDMRTMTETPVRRRTSNGNKSNGTSATAAAAAAATPVTPSAEKKHSTCLRRG